MHAMTELIAVLVAFQPTIFAAGRIMTVALMIIRAAILATHVVYGFVYYKTFIADGNGLHQSQCTVHGLYFAHEL